MQRKHIAIILGIGLMLSGCSALKRNNFESFNSGDAIPLYPITTTGKPAKSLDGRWYIKSVGTITLRHFEDEEWPYIEFIPTEARFYGHDGCNIINGTYRIPSGQTLQLSNVATTMKMCEGDTLAYPIAKALNDVSSFSTSNGADGSRILNLYNAANHTVMTLRSSDIDFLNGPWQVVAINGHAINVADARLVFDVDSNTVTGNAGCNRLSGKLTRNPQTSAAVQFSDLATTRMTCPDIETESALLIALEEVTHARHHKDSVELLDAAGKAVVKLTKLNKTDF
ncbi:MAG: META domain-containing protein [Bacteroides sp.]|nr:META domain-containing protein [Bacteroides sp.]MCM1379414.1 META domain-containing protein [Bacteroides sp.]MCM1445274.1 META domain-containing protein [Prevotella sp.]